MKKNKKKQSVKAKQKHNLITSIIKIAHFLRVVVWIPVCAIVQVDTLLIDLSDCTKEDGQIQSLTKIAKR